MANASAGIEMARVPNPLCTPRSPREQSLLRRHASAVTSYDQRMTALAKVMEEALALPLQERTKLASELLASIEGEGESESDVEAAWAAEIDRRADRALRGESVGTDWTIVRDEVRARLRAAR